MLPLLTVLVMALRVSSTPENVLVVVLNKNYGVAEKNKVDTKSSYVVMLYMNKKYARKGRIVVRGWLKKCTAFIKVSQIQLAQLKKEKNG